MKKIIKILIIFIIVSNIIFPIYADDEETEIEDINIEEIIEASAKPTNIPTINSRAAVIYDRTSGTVIYGKEENTKRKMASTTKIMTCLVTLEHANLTDTVEVSKKAAGTGGSRLGLTSGAKITVNDLLYGLMLCSGNDAAVALAEYVAGSISEFANLMNEKAKEIGLENTHFVTPHGLDEEEHYTTAYELAKLADYALNIEKFANIVKTKTYTITINGNTKQLNNTNELLGNLNGVYGVKTGFTNGANRCLVTAIKRDNLDVICVVLGADTKKYRTQDSIKLIEYAFKNYEIVDLDSIIEKEFIEWKKENLQAVEIIKGKEDYANLIINLHDKNSYPVNKEEIKDINVEIQTEKILNAPVYKNQVIGKLTLKIGDKIIKKGILDTYTDMTDEDVEKYFRTLGTAHRTLGK